MKKFMFSLLLFVASMSAAVAQNHYFVPVGAGTETNYVIPSNSYYENSCSQMIYTANEVGIDGVIDTIKYQVTGTTSTRDITIYMAEVSQSSYTSTSARVPASAFRQVFNGSVTFSAGWVSIALDSTFCYQDTGSLVIHMIDNTGDYEWDYPYFYGTEMANTRTLYDYADGENYQLNHTFPYSSSFLPNIQLGLTTSSSYCAGVSNVSVSNIAGTNATFSWQENGTATAWQVIVSDSVVTDFSEWSPVNAYDTTYTETMLGGNTLYYVYVRANCGTDSYSGWYGPATFTSACTGYTAVPYTTGFEGLTTGQVPNCWLQVMTGSSSSSTFPAAYEYSGNTHSGSVYFEMESSSGQTEIAALPAMDNINTLQLEFYASILNNNFTLEAGVMEDSVFVPVDTVALQTSGSTFRNSYRLYTVYFNNYSGDGERMALRTTASGSYTLMIDDLTVSAIPSCIDISGLTATSTGSDEITLHWTSNGSETAWNVYYDTVVMTSTMNGINTTSNDTSIVLNGLNAATWYYLYVQSDCGSDGQANWVGPVSVRTDLDCGDNAFVIGSIGNGINTCTNVPCYTGWGSSISQMIYTYQDLASDGVYEGNIYSITYDWGNDGSSYPKNVKIYMALTDKSEFTSTTDWLADSCFTLVWQEDGYAHPQGLATYALTAPFHVSGDSNLCIAVISNHNGSNTYNATYSARYTSASNNRSLYKYADNTLYTISDFSSLTGYTTTNLPNIRLEACVTLPECAMPNSFVLVGTDSNSATLAWNELGSAATWNVYYDTVLMDSAMNGTTITSYTDTVTVYNLIGGTRYYMYVRSDCGSDVSDWIGPITATPNVWITRANHTDTVRMCGGIIYDDGGTDDSYTSNQNSTIILYPTDTTMGLHLTGTVDAEGYGYDYLRIYDGVGTSSTLLYDGSSATGIETVDVTSTGHALTLVFVSDISYNESGYELHVECYDLSCAAVSALAATVSDASSVTLDWSPNGTESGWIIEYKDGAFTFGDSTATRVSVSTHPYTVTGLTANTLYHFAVAADCGSAVSFAQTTTRRTACSGYAAVPFTENFDALSTGDMPNCWVRVQSGTSYSDVLPAAYNYSYQAHSGTNSFRMESDGSDTEIAALPAMDSISALQLDFYAATSLGIMPLLEVGVMENDTTFVPVDTVTLGALNSYSFDYRLYTVYLSHYTGTGDRIALRTSGTEYSVFIDDLSVTYQPSCIAPAGLNITGSTSTSLTLSWTEMGSATQWELARGTSASFVPVSGSIVTSNPYTDNTVTSGTTYYYAVRSICGAGDTSDWSTILSATPGTYTMRHGFSDTIAMCGGIIYDCGGENENYGNSCDETLVIRPSSASNAVNLQGSYNMESGYDYIYVYNGEGTTGTLLGTFSGSGSLNLTSTAANGALTLRLTSDGSVNYSGFAFNVSCVSNTCPAPDSLVASNVTASDADISWSSAAPDFILEYGPAGFAAGTGISVNLTSASYSMSGLTGNTAYDVRVTPICTGADTGMTAVLTFSTGCYDDAVTIFPWVETFEAGLDCWNQQYVTEYQDWEAASGLDEYSSITSAQSGSNNALFLGWGDDEETFLISPALNLSAASAPVLMTFYHAQEDWYGDQDTLGIYYRTSDTGSWNYIASWTSSIDHWQLDSVYLPNPSATYQIGFLAYSGYGYGVGLDSIVVYGPETNCPAPVVTNTVSDFESITLTWNGSAASYEVALKPTTTAIWPDATTVTGNSYTFTGLSPLTTYHYRLRALCDEGETSGWTNGAAATEDLPCFVPENVVATGVTADEATISWQVNPLATTNTFVVKLYNTTMEVFDTVNTTSATFTELYDNTLYNATVKSLCSDAISSEWSEPVSFTTSACATPGNVSVSDITSHGATVTWVPAGSESSWEVSYGVAGFGTGDGTNVTVSESRCVINGLMDEQSYDVYVRALCSETAQSQWSTRVTFTTLAANGIDDNYRQGLVTIYPNPAKGSTTVAINGVDGKVNAAVIDMTGRTLATYQFDCSGDCEKRIDVTNLAQGTYFVRISTERTTLVRKVVVE